MRAASGGVTSRALVPPTKDLDVLRSAAKGCTGCDLFKQATQTVFGEGPSSASIVLVGEQPGDAEDIAGRPFVGPAGALLERALADAGIVRSSVYVTNAVKHFAWEPSGKRRIHRTPTALGDARLPSVGRGGTGVDCAARRSYASAAPRRRRFSVRRRVCMRCEAE